MVTRQAFRYTGLAGSTPPLATGTQTTASTSQQPDDLLPRQPAPKTVQYQPPSFRLARPLTHLTRNERIQVHHNYILAVSSLEHKKDLINRLKRSDTHNIPAYEAEMSRHMALHEDVLERILNILKQDDYYRTLEDLPVIDELTAYDDIAKCFLPIFFHQIVHGGLSGFSAVCWFSCFLSCLAQSVCWFGGIVVRGCVSRSLLGSYIHQESILIM